MSSPARNKKIQDWITQGWVIATGKKISPNTDQWVIGPMGSTNGIGTKFIHELAKEEKLEFDTNSKRKGLIPSLLQLDLPSEEFNQISPQVIDFYENTSSFSLKLTVRWNPIFKLLGRLIRWIFSSRIEQLNIPMSTSAASELSNEVIHLIDSETKQVQRVIWLRTFQNSGEVVYSGVYGTCTIPSGITCIKAVFPLPNGNATVILKPVIGKDGSLHLESSGKKIGDSGFYFTLVDKHGQLWAKYVRSFEDSLVVSSSNGDLQAVQTLKLWGLKVLTFQYDMHKSG